MMKPQAKKRGEISPNRVGGVVPGEGGVTSRGAYTPRARGGPVTPRHSCSPARLLGKPEAGQGRPTRPVTPLSGPNPARCSGPLPPAQWAALPGSTALLRPARARDAPGGRAAGDLPEQRQSRPEPQQPHHAHLPASGKEQQAGPRPSGPPRSAPSGQPRPQRRSFRGCAV